MYANYMTTFPSVTDFALTVSDIDRSVAWYETLLGTAPIFVGDEPAFRFAVWLEPVFGLHQRHDGCDGEGIIDEHRLGLEHIAFSCASRNELEAWLERLEELGIEHGEIV